MPHIVVKLFPGRSDEQKEACANKISEAVIETLGTSEAHVSVAFNEVDPKNWKQVYDLEIVSEEENLYKKPGYYM